MKPNATEADIADADKALEEIATLRMVVETLRPFSKRQRARILAFVTDELEERAEEKRRAEKPA